MNHVRLFLLAVALLLASCGGGGGDGPAPAPQAATFAFRVQGAGAEQEFRYATSSLTFISAARAQLSLPVAGRKQFPSGAIDAGNDGINLNWNWHFTDMAFVEAAIGGCDGTPSMVEADVAYWVNTVKRFCPWGGYVYAEVTGNYTLTQFAIGQVRAIAQENMTIELKDVTDSRCPAAAICVTAGTATASLVVSVAGSEPKTITVTLDGTDREAQGAVVGAYRITLDKLDPFPISGPAPKDQFRATVTVRKQ